MYITRNIEQTINRISNQFKVLLLTGARQVGKTTLLKHLAQGSGRTYVTLDDLAVRSLALNDPALFLQRYTPPLLIDEIQYAPQLYYLRNFNDKEIELIIWQNGTAYPVAIKKSAYHSKAVKTFAILEPVSVDAKIQIGVGGIVCLIDDLLPASDNLYYIPAWVL